MFAVLDPYPHTTCEADRSPAHSQLLCRAGLLLEQKNNSSCRLPQGLHSWKLKWKPKRGPIKPTISKMGLYGFPCFSFGECM